MTLDQVLEMDPLIPFEHHDLDGSTRTTCYQLSNLLAWAGDLETLTSSYPQIQKTIDALEECMVGL